MLLKILFKFIEHVGLVGDYLEPFDESWFARSETLDIDVGSDTDISRWTTVFL